MNHNIFIPLLLLLAVTLSSCFADNNGGRSKSNEADGNVLNVVATTGMIADVVRIVGGDRVEVKCLMGPGVDPHLYKASAGDVALLSKADIIFYNGLHLEGKMSEVFERMEKRRIDTVAVTDGISRGRLLAPPEFKGNYDPHVWFDVALWMDVVGSVRDNLSKEDRDNAAIYSRNALAYLAELSRLNEHVKAMIETLPKERRVLVTAHDAFNYFGKGYGFEVRGLQGISTESEAGTADVQSLAYFIVERQIPAIFIESSVQPKYIEAVQASVKAKGFSVEIGGKLFSDAMGNPGKPEGNYIGMVRYNVGTIVNALKSKERF